MRMLVKSLGREEERIFHFECIYAIIIMKKIKFEYHVRGDGKTEFTEFVDGLPLKDQQKLLATILLIQENGMLMAQKAKWVKKISDNLFEIRSSFGNNIQRVIYFHVSDNRYVITHGFTKKTEKTPMRQISHALKMREEFEKRENNAQQ